MLYSVEAEMADNITELDATIEGMLNPQRERFAALGAAMQGAGAEPHATLKSLTDFAQAMDFEATKAASDIAAIRVDPTIVHDERHLPRFAEDQRLTEAHAVIDKWNGLSQGLVKTLEAQLEAGSLPQPSKDAAERGLTWRGLEFRYGRSSDPDKLVATAMRSIGADPAQDAELFSSSLGADFLKGPGGLNEDQVAGLRQAAVDHYVSRQDGSRTAQAYRRGLTVFRASKISGAVSGFRAAAGMRLSQFEESPRGQLIPDARAAARDRKGARR